MCVCVSACGACLRLYTRSLYPKCSQPVNYNLSSHHHHRLLWIFLVRNHRIAMSPKELMTLSGVHPMTHSFCSSSAEIAVEDVWDCFFFFFFRCRRCCCYAVFVGWDKPISSLQCKSKAKIVHSVQSCNFSDRFYFRVLEMKSHSDSLQKASNSLSAVICCAFAAASRCCDENIQQSTDSAFPNLIRETCKRSKVKFTRFMV